MANSWQILISFSSSGRLIYLFMWSLGHEKARQRPTANKQHLKFYKRQWRQFNNNGASSFKIFDSWFRVSMRRMFGVNRQEKLLSASRVCIPHRRCPTLTLSRKQLLLGSRVHLLSSLCSSYSRLYPLSQTQAPPSEKPPPRLALWVMCLFLLRQVHTS